MLMLFLFLFPFSKRRTYISISFKERDVMKMNVFVLSVTDHVTDHGNDQCYRPGGVRDSGLTHV